jgi:hypothetical protein
MGRRAAPDRGGRLVRHGRTRPADVRTEGAAVRRGARSGPVRSIQTCGIRGFEASSDIRTTQPERRTRHMGPRTRLAREAMGWAARAAYGWHPRAHGRVSRCVTVDQGQASHSSVRERSLRMVTPDRAGDAYRFDALRARYKRSPRDQQHGGTIDRSRAATEERGVTTELVLRVIDHDIAVGVWQDVSEHGWKCRGPERRTARSEERPAPWTRGVHGDVTKLPVMSCRPRARHPPGASSACPPLCHRPAQLCPGGSWHRS